MGEKYPFTRVKYTGTSYMFSPTKYNVSENGKSIHQQITLCTIPNISFYCIPDHYPLSFTTYINLIFREEVSCMVFLIPADLLWRCDLSKVWTRYPCEEDWFLFNFSIKICLHVSTVKKLWQIRQTVCTMNC